MLGDLSVFVGREREIQQVIETLCRRTKRNPVLVGPAGVGKTAIIEGLARKIAKDKVPEKLENAQIFSVRASSLISGTWWYGTLEYRVKNLLAEAKRDGVIVFIDELHTIVGTGPESTRDISQQLKPVLARGEILLIGATTNDEYRRFIQTDSALERRFQPVQVEELTSEETFKVLHALRRKADKKNQLAVSEDILKTIIDYAERFLQNRYFPDKAIDLFEQTIAFAETAGKKDINPEAVDRAVQKNDRDAGRSECLSFAAPGKYCPRL